MGPGLYSDIGKKARDLLYKDFQTDRKFTVATYTPTGVVEYSLSATTTRKGDGFLTDVNTRLKLKNAIADLKVGLIANPIADFSFVAGCNVASVGTNVSFDTKTKTFTKFNVGIGFSHDDLVAALTVTDKGDKLNGSYHHVVNRNTSVAAELSHSLSTKENILTIGAQHSPASWTTVKVRVNNIGKAGILFQHELGGQSLTFCGEVDTKSVKRSVKFGTSLSISLKPW